MSVIFFVYLPIQRGKLLSAIMLFSTESGWGHCFPSHTTECPEPSVMTLSAKMEEWLCAPGTPRRRTPLPLGQLVEESKNRAKIPNHLLETKIYAKMSSALIQAEPSELHFSGFQPGKEYLKSLKLINISSEVMNIHIIPTQTEHFHTTYTKKYRLIPGLAYTVNIHFCPDEWRYFQDCVRVHCKGEENLLILVHAYPVIDDLHIPPRIDLPAVPIGHRVIHAIPLRCSCPIDFEFQLRAIQPHEAFSIHLMSVDPPAQPGHGHDSIKRSSIHGIDSCATMKTLKAGFGSSDPLTGVIPANGEVKILVTFSPIQYETAQLTIQLVISQFNSKPYLCTITGSSAPYLTSYREVMQKSMVPGDCKGSPPKTSLANKVKFRAPKEALQTGKSQADVKSSLDPKVDPCTPAGVSKMLIKDSCKLTSKDLRDVISGGSMVGLKNRQMKEAFFVKQVQQYMRDEQANSLKRQVHLGKDPVSDRCRKQILNEREIARKEYMARRGIVRDGQEFVFGQPRLSSVRVLCDAGQTPTGSPSFQYYSSFNWELKHRALRLFQQAARKVLIRCRMNRRLALLKHRRPPSEQKEEKLYDWTISPDQVFASSFPIFSEIDDTDQLVQVPTTLETLPVEHVTMHIPYFELQIPEHYRVMGYRPVTTWDAFSTYIPTTLARPLRTDNLVMIAVDLKQGKQEMEEEEVPSLDLNVTFPEALLKPVSAHPLRIFNPAPGLQTYKPTPKYLESDLEYHLCPLPRYPPVDKSPGKCQERKVTIEEILTWKNFDSITTHYLSTRQTQTTDFAMRSCVDYNPDILPVVTPPALSSPLADMPAPEDDAWENAAIQLTPQMIRAEFLSGEVGAHLAATLAGWQLREHQIEATYKPKFNQMGKRVMAMLKQLGPADEPPPSLCQKPD
ncbi:cilia- and flagella-associated protein 221 isoform X2 [Synchiropus splendidus]|uniref:cilia- and flagella-associated protein 221 isoform X2 n=1 Tax=Synchiropus splendidus TaxID=270530 RepID=UPI00237E7F66|nr:cilia- and flagella-associated protein 221 isoform X2 [Synchiropus splendidus]